FFLLASPSQRSTLFPYTTLFRSRLELAHALLRAGAQLADRPELDRIGGARFRAGGLESRPHAVVAQRALLRGARDGVHVDHAEGDRKSTRLNSSHVATSYAVFCL